MALALWGSELGRWLRGLNNSIDSTPLKSEFNKEPPFSSPLIRMNYFPSLFFSTLSSFLFPDQIEHTYLMLLQGALQFVCLL